ncbi:MAG TPA: anti-sigma factor [Sphingomicrobium sp.]|nr:anti-sigma factor [Sphingomicrobium sp.]
MSRRDISSEERGQLAAEYALGVLEGDELAVARDLLQHEAEFRRDVGRWLGRFAPLLEEVGEVQPPASVWAAVQRRIAAVSGANDNERLLERRLTRWRVAAGGATALAASLALILLTRPAAVPPPPAAPSAQAPAASPMLAMLGDERQPNMLVASWDPGSRNLVIAAAATLRDDPAHDHELWVIPADGKPRSLGVLPQNARMHARLDPAMARELHQGATLAVSVEPPGGSPADGPTGPVVASGKLERA